MAIFPLDERMVFWKIYVYDEDITNIIAPYVNSISVTHSILPAKSKTDEKNFPFEASISIISKDYIENVFTEGMPIKIYMGYNRILTELDLVFKGEMITYPDGQAKEMQSYTIKAYGTGDPEMVLTQKNRTFLGKTKSMIVKEVMSSYIGTYSPIVSIKEDIILHGKYSPQQQGESDFVFLQKLAKSWNCVAWFKFPSTFYFVDAADAHDFNPTLFLGYRTDKLPSVLPGADPMETRCNVETVSWSHNPARAAESFNAGVNGLGEDGDLTDPDTFKINALGKTWVLKEKYAKTLDKEKNPNWGEYARLYAEISSKMTFSWQGYAALKLFYRPMDDDPTAQRSSAHDDSGWDISIRLNLGNSQIRPPVNARLYYGSVNPKADSSLLPFYIHYYSDPTLDYIKLKVNEVTTTYAEGKLTTDLKCTIGRFA